MRVLFYTTTRVTVQEGGTERITARVIKGLRSCGYCCYSAFSEDIPDEFPRIGCDGEFRYSREMIYTLLKGCAIDVIVLQKMTRDVVWLKEMIQITGNRCQLISVLHFNPGYEEMALSFHNFLPKTIHTSIKEKVKDVVRLCTYPLYKLLYPLRNRELYRTVYKYSDSVVVLGNTFVEEYRNYAHLSSVDKLHVIPNALSFDGFASQQQLGEKKNTVLIVSRMDEVQKRISDALKIWVGIEANPELAKWQLKIVGHGKDLPRYQELVKELKLERVSFEGRQDPVTYYREAKVFMMTSAYEGWGLTLTEAQQWGCVPVAFDSFSSLKDIISDAKNGYIIPNHDKKEYLSQLSNLMLHHDIWMKMSMNAVESSKRYSLDRVIQSWKNLFDMQ